MKYIYYRIYKLFCDDPASKDVAEYYALALISVCISLNIGVIPLFYKIKHPQFLNNLTDNINLKSIALGIYAAIVIVNYFVFIFRKRYAKIAAEYKDAEPKDAYIKIYGVATIILPILYFLFL